MSASHFFEVEALVGAGRLGEAAAALRGSARAGGQAWESYIWLGRIEENRGRLERAEAAFRRAMAAAPASPLPRIELSRLLEKAGRAQEADEVLRTAAAQAAGELSLLADDLLAARPGGAAESLYALMEFNLYRRAFLEAVRARGADLGRIEAAVRGALGAVPQPGARTLLAEVLLERGRPAQAAAELAAAFAAPGRAAETSRFEVLLKLVERGRYGRALEKAVLGCLWRSEPSDKLARDWPRLFAALMCAGRYRAAFRLGEARLDKLGRFESPQHLLWPWWPKVARAVSEQGFLDRELARLRRAGRSGGLAHWFAYYRAILLSDRGGHNEEAMAEYALIRDLDAERYSWMSQSFVLVKLGLLEFDGAIAICRRVLQGAPSHWWVRCRLAEAYLAQGDRAAARRELERAQASCDPAAQREVLTWHGEILLWLGDYAGALEKLDAAAALGAETFVFGWRGAARLLSGDAAGALVDLDRAVARDAKDFEARLWRGEAHRLAGRWSAAREDLDLVVERAPDLFWARFDRGLLRAALGDEAGLAVDYAAIAASLTARLALDLGLPAEEVPAPEAMRKVLASGLERARGVRRWEGYVQTVWLGSSR